MASNRKTAIARRDEIYDADEQQLQTNIKSVSNALKIKLDHLKGFEPLTDNQSKFFELYRGGAYCMGMFGSPGVGKTFLSLYKAIEEVLDKSNSFKQVVVVRSAVQVRDQGFVPGDLEEKMQIYEQPYKEICQTLFGRGDAWDRLKEQGYARFISTTAIRGISIDDAIIIVDECQSMTWHELSSVISRTGHRSKIIFVGDLKQNDLVKSKHDTSGLKQFLEVLHTMKEYQSVEFTPDDIVRSSLVKSFIMACDKLGY
jgi:phosphate starvation-inducible protein PhoH and related proteins